MFFCRSAWLSGLAAIGLWLAASSQAICQPSDFSQYQIDLGPAPADGETAFNTIAQRRETVIRWNACGRDLQFLGRIANNSKTEETTLSAIIGKIAWLQSHAGEKCSQTVRLTPGEAEGLAGSGEKDAINRSFEAIFGSRLCTDPLVGERRDVPGSDYKDYDLEVSWNCMRQQVNVAMNQATVLGNPGTTGLPCHVTGEAPEAEWDVSVRDIMRVLLLDRTGVLDDSTREYVFNNLATISGPVEESSYSVFECGNTERDTGSPQDRADERDWEDDGLWGDIGDLLKWLLNRIEVFAAIAAALIIASVVPGLQWIIPIIGTVAVTTIVASGIRIQESENHLFMINSSRFLANKIMVETLSDEDQREEWQDDLDDTKEWLLDRMKTVAEDDFLEYNARPYQRYTLPAILNLHDFSGDRELRDASRILLDFATAKFAAGSSQGRRYPPFRRLMEVIPGDVLAGRRLFDLAGDADHLIAAMLLYAGQTQQLPDRKATISGVAEMIHHATSDYAPHSFILEAAANKSVAYDQRIHHDGFELYSSAPGYLITAGGIQTTLANKAVIGFEFAPPKGFKFDNDRGTAVPTTLMAHGGTPQLVATDFLRIEGDMEVYGSVKARILDPPQEISAWSRDHNLCVRKGFACGTNIVVPDALQGCLSSVAGARPQWSFIDSATCGPYQGAERFYVVVFRDHCVPASADCNVTNWGFFEAVPANGQPPFDEFKQQTIDRNETLFVTSQIAVTSRAPMTYTSARGERLAFSVLGHAADDDSYGIINRQRSEGDIDDWPLGAATSSNRRRGPLRIFSPGDRSSRIDIDFTDEDDPRWSVVP